MVRTAIWALSNSRRSDLGPTVGASSDKLLKSNIQSFAQITMLIQTAVMSTAQPFSS